MRIDIDLVAYADDYTARGEIMLRAPRLADHLDGADELRLQGVTVRALEDGREHNLPFAVIHRDELCLVAATGPRGSAALRFPTRQHPMRAELGPYVAVGYFHAVATADPRVVALNREIIALSPARLAYLRAGEPIDESHDGLLLVRAKITLFESTSDDDVAVSKALDVDHPQTQ
jgi:hypothetical protein